MNEKIERAKSLLTEVRAEMNGPAFSDANIQAARFSVNVAVEEIEGEINGERTENRPYIMALLSDAASNLEADGENQQAENWRGMITEAASLLYEAGPFGKEAQ